MTDSANLVFDGTNLGIGTTTPSSKLTVVGNSYLNGDLTVTGTSTFSNSLTMSGTAANIILGSNWLSSDGDDEGVYVNSIGDVSIGTTTAVAKFNVNGSIYVPNDNGYITKDASDNTVSLLSMTSANNVLVNGSTVGGNLIFSVPNDVGDIQFETGSGLNPVMKILNNGNVGIGTTTPTSKLTVVGDVNIQGTATSSAVITFRDPIGNISLEMRAGTSTLENTFIGRNVGRINTTGGNNVALGTTALYSNTTGGSNTAVGWQALFTNATGSNNTAVGFRSLNANLGSENTAYGSASLLNNTNGTANTAVGLSALISNTTGSNNTAMGIYALSSNVDGDNNTAVGFSALDSNVDGRDNTAVGRNAGFDINTAVDTGDNTIIGYNTGRGIVTGVNNTVLGANVSGLSSTLSNNIIIADGAGNQRINVGSTGNVGIGTTTPSDKLTVIGNTYLNGSLTLTGAFKDSINATGTVGMVLQTTGTSTRWVATSTLGITGGASTFLSLTDTPSSFTANRLLFTNSGATALTDSSSLVFDGTNLGLGTASPSSRLDVTGTATSSAVITFRDPIGDISLEMRAGTSSLENTFIGTEAGAVNASGNNSVAFGFNTLHSNTTGGSNIAVGWQALYSNISGSNNTASGFRSLYANLGSENTAYGYGSLRLNTTGSENTASGLSALSSNITGSYNTAMGTYAMTENTTGVSNTAFGYAALESNTTGAYNTALGRNAGGDINTATSTGANTIIGYNTGRGIVTGVNNTVLGANVSGLSSALSNNIIIADGAGNQRINVGSDGNIGIGTTTPSAKLTVTQSANTATGGIWLATADNTDFRSQFMATSGVLSFYGGDTGGTLNTATLNAAGEWTNASDLSYKKNIEKLSYGLDTVLALQPRSYDIKNTDNHRIGFIAQEVEEVIPEVVSGEDGTKGISYGNLVAVAISAIQELAGKVSGFAESITTKFMKAEQIQTNTLCLDDLCITKSQLQDILNNQTNNPPQQSPTPSIPEISEDMDTTEDNSTITEQLSEEVNSEIIEQADDNVEVIAEEEIVEANNEVETTESTPEPNS